MADAQEAPSGETMDRSAFPKEQWAKPSSAKSNFDNPSVPINLLVKDLVIDAPADWFTHHFNDMLQVQKEGVGPAPYDGKFGKPTPAALGLMRTGPGPLCCFDDQIVEFEPESSGLMTFQVVTVRYPLACCCAGYLAHLTAAPHPDFPDSKTIINFDSAHDCAPCCACCPLCFYPCGMAVCKPFHLLFYAFACKYNKRCCCFPDCLIFTSRTWTTTCCVCLKPCCLPQQPAA